MKINSYNFFPAKYTLSQFNSQKSESKALESQDALPPSIVALDDSVLEQ